MRIHNLAILGLIEYAIQQYVPHFLVGISSNLPFNLVLGFTLGESTSVCVSRTQYVEISALTTVFGAVSRGQAYIPSIIVMLHFGWVSAS